MQTEKNIFVIPLDTPPIILASTKIAKFEDMTHRKYENEMPTQVAIISGFLPNLSLRPPMMGLARNWRNEKMDPRKPPNNTVLNSTGAPTLSRNQSTFKR